MVIDRESMVQKYSGCRGRQDSERFLVGAA